MHATQLFEFVKAIADFSTVDRQVRLSTALIQPISSDDFAAAVGRVAVGEPGNGIREIAGPEEFPLDELVRRGLGAKNDPREVAADEQALYYGAHLGERTLVPGLGAELGGDTFEKWSARQ